LENEKYERLNMALQRSAATRGKAKLGPLSADFMSKFPRIDGILSGRNLPHKKLAEVSTKGRIGFT
jgi:hypothetical protein